MEQQKQNNNSKQYGEQKIQEMVDLRLKKLKSEGIFQSLQDIYVKQPESRIMKDNYSFTFDTVRNHIEDRVAEKTKIQKILINEMKNTTNIQIRALREVPYDNQDELYTEKLKSGLPIFKSIQFLRFQENQNWSQFLGEQKPFIEDQLNIDFGQIKADIAKIKYFLVDDEIMPQINLFFVDHNKIDVKFDRFPTMHELEKRADVMAKLFLFNIFTDEHRKLKQAWKNDEKYQQMQRNEKKMKGFMQPQKAKQAENQQQQQLLKLQVKKIFEKIQQRANFIANQQFKQLNGEKAVSTKKSLEKLKNILRGQKNPRQQLKYLIAYKQKKSW